MSSVPQGSPLGPVLFNIFSNELDRGVECALSTFVDDMKPGGVADSPEGCTAIQRDLNRPERWADKNPMKFNKCRGLPLGRNHPRHQDRLGATHLESSSAGTDLWLLLSTKRNVSQRWVPAAKKADGIGCIRQSIASSQER